MAAVVAIGAIIVPPIWLFVVAEEDSGTISTAIGGLLVGGTTWLIIAGIRGAAFRLTKPQIDESDTPAN